jgi:hypothetical protein
MAEVFEKYRLGDRPMLCLWYNGQLNTAIRDPSRIFELKDRLKEWLQELRSQEACNHTTTSVLV